MLGLDALFLEYWLDTVWVGVRPGQGMVSSFTVYKSSRHSVKVFSYFNCTKVCIISEDRCVLLKLLNTSGPLRGDSC